MASYLELLARLEIDVMGFAGATYAGIIVGEAAYASQEWSLEAELVKDFLFLAGAFSAGRVFSLGGIYHRLVKGYYSGHHALEALATSGIIGLHSLAASGIQDFSEAVLKYQWEPGDKLWFMLAGAAVGVGLNHLVRSAGRPEDTLSLKPEYLE